MEKYNEKKQKLNIKRNHSAHISVMFQCQCQCHQKINTVTPGRHKFNSLGFFGFFYQKMRKKYDNIMFNFHQKNYIQKMIFIYF